MNKGCSLLIFLSHFNGFRLGLVLLDIGGIWFVFFIVLLDCGGLSFGVLLGIDLSLGRVFLIVLLVFFLVLFFVSLLVFLGLYWWPLALFLSLVSRFHHGFHCLLNVTSCLMSRLILCLIQKWVFLSKLLDWFLNNSQALDS